MRAVCRALPNALNTDLLSKHFGSPMKLFGQLTALFIKHGRIIRVTDSSTKVIKLYIFFYLNTFFKNLLFCFTTFCTVTFPLTVRALGAT